MNCLYATQTFTRRDYTASAPLPPDMSAYEGPEIVALDGVGWRWKALDGAGIMRRGFNRMREIWRRAGGKGWARVLGAGCAADRGQKRAFDEN